MCYPVLNCFSCVWLYVAPWIPAHQAALSTGFSMQQYWSGLPCPPPRDLPYPRIKPTSLKSPALAGGFFTTSTTWEALSKWYVNKQCWSQQKQVALRRGFILATHTHKDLESWWGFLFAQNYLLDNQFRLSLSRGHLASPGVAYLPYFRLSLSSDHL